LKSVEKLLAGDRVRASLLRDPAMPTTVKLRSSAPTATADPSALSLSQRAQSVAGSGRRDRRRLKARGRSWVEVQSGR